MGLIDYLKRRTNIVEVESNGLNAAIGSIREFEGRRFTFKGLQSKYTGMDSDQLLKRLEYELNHMAILYRYITKIKTYTDRKGRTQLHLQVQGKAGMMSKYNPLDIRLEIVTESNTD